MATDEVFMDIPQVQNMAKNFNTFGDILHAAATALQAISISLKAAAWLSLGASYAAAMYIDRIQPNVKKAGDEMRKISQDIGFAITAYQGGDAHGSTRFI